MSLLDRITQEKKRKQSQRQIDFTARINLTQDLIDCVDLSVEHNLVIPEGDILPKKCRIQRDGTYLVLGYPHWDKDFPANIQEIKTWRARFLLTQKEVINAFLTGELNPKDHSEIREAFKIK